MKSLLIPACCAVALASAAELKDPSEVALDLKLTVLEAKVATKRAAIAGQIGAIEKSSSQTFDFGLSNPAPVVRPRKAPAPFYDAPNYRNRGTLPTDRPRGAKPWEYNGEIYWIVPLSPAKSI